MNDKFLESLDMVQVFIRRNPFLIVLVLIVILVIFYLLNFRFGISKLNSDWGAFGDYFNGVSAPFIGIIGIVLTFTIINNQTRESKQSEFKFIFELIYTSLDREIEKIVFKKGKKNYKGHRAILMINNHMNGIIDFNINNRQITDINEVVRFSFTTIQRDCNYTFATYMKNIHNCLKIIDQQCNDEHKETYIHLVKAGLSKNQVAFFLYNGIGKPEFIDFKERLERFKILEGIRNDLMIREEVKGLYKWN